MSRETAIEVESAEIAAAEVELVLATLSHELLELGFGIDHADSTGAMLLRPESDFEDGTLYERAEQARKLAEVLLGLGQRASILAGKLSALARVGEFWTPGKALSRAKAIEKAEAAHHRASSASRGRRGSRARQPKR